MAQLTDTHQIFYTRLTLVLGKGRSTQWIYLHHFLFLICYTLGNAWEEEKK